MEVVGGGAEGAGNLGEAPGGNLVGTAMEVFSMQGYLSRASGWSVRSAVQLCVVCDGRS